MPLSYVVRSASCTMYVLHVHVLAKCAGRYLEQGYG